MRMRGGSPKNKRQGQYWVRQNLDDQKRALASLRRAERTAERDRKLQLKASAAELKEQERKNKEQVAAHRRLGLWEHFAKIQEEMKRALSLFTMDVGNGRYELTVEFETEQHREDMNAAHAAYQEHANWLNENPQSMTATNLSKHVQNTKRFLTAFGRATGTKCRWDLQEQSFTFGDLTLDFSADKPPAKPTIEKARPARNAIKLQSDPPSAVSAPDHSKRHLLLLFVGGYAVCVAVTGFMSGWSSIGTALGEGLAIFVILVSLVAALIQKSVWLALIPLMITIVMLEKCQPDTPASTAQRDRGAQNSMDRWLKAQ